MISNCNAVIVCESVRTDERDTSMPLVTSVTDQITQEAQAIVVKHSRFWIEDGQRTGTCYKRPQAKLADLFPTCRGQHRIIRCGPKSPPRGCAALKARVFALLGASEGA